jgi:mannose-6-phosphate isomerase
MNYLQLSAGDSIYIPADGIHAYLSGDIIECMARSNNVLCTGFCPPANRNSAEIFCSALTFTPHDTKEALLPPKLFEGAESGKTKVYAPPMSEFNVLATGLGKVERETIRAIRGPSIMVVTKGDGTMRADGREYELREGYVFFVGHGVETEFDAASGLQVFRAYVE